jgi:hypothetical protein
MDAELQAVADALADLADAELHALVEGANEYLLFAAGFLSWVEHLADWEINRRAGRDFPLRPPHTEIPPHETATSVDVATMLRERFSEIAEEERCTMVGLFDAVVGALVGRTDLQS